jgi:membrane protein implicated in regulation of membrane protease activity
MAHLAAGSQQQHVQAARTDVPSPAVAVSPAQNAATHVSRWLYAAAGFCLIACAALGYFGQVWPAMKCGIAGITLPVFAAWYSEHWAWVIAGLLVAFAIYFVVYQHKFIKPLHKRIEELESHFVR